MSSDAVLTIFDDLKKRMLKINDQNPAKDGIVFSMMPMGQPVNAADFRDPWSPYDVEALEVIPADASEEARRRADRAAEKRSNSVRSAANLSRFVNRKVRLNERWEVQAGAALIDDSWDAIVNTAGVAVAAPEPTAQAKERLHKAELKLRQPRPGRPGQVDPTPEYQSYLEYKKLYEDACLARNDAYATAMRSAAGLNSWPITGKIWAERVDTALGQWESLGFRNEIESAQDTISAQGRDAAAYVLDKARAAFNAWRLSAGVVGAPLISYTQCFPSDWAEPTAGDSGWTSYGFHQSDESENHSTSAQSWSAGGSVSFGFWSVGGSGGNSSRTEHSEYSSEAFGLELKYGLVMIDRPWLSTSLLNVNGWGLPGQDRFVVSDGSSVQDQARAGANAVTWLPCLPTHLIVIKEVRIKTASIQKVYDERVQNSGGGASLGWGPFSFGGGGSSSSTDLNKSCHMEDGWLVIDGAQVIGCLLEVMPKSPPEAMK